MARPGKATKRAKRMTRGHAVTKLPKVKKPSELKGRLGKRTDHVRKVIRSVVGYSPYEKKLMELIQAGGSKEEKKALKLAKKRLGTHKRGLKKRESIRAMLQAARYQD